MKLPDLVGEYIDQNILPNFANGYNTAEMIYEEVLDLVIATTDSIEDYKNLGMELYSDEDGDQQLIDCYWIASHNKQTIVDYIEEAWKDWEEPE